MGHFTDSQHDLIANMLLVMFGAENDQELMVLFPETLIKLYMNFHVMEYGKAEDELFDMDIYNVSYMCSLSVYKQVTSVFKCVFKYCIYLGCLTGEV
jgi:hypothetical protein